jgi:hypothetical protein
MPRPRSVLARALGRRVVSAGAALAGTCTLVAIPSWAAARLELREPPWAAAGVLAAATVVLLAMLAWDLAAFARVRRLSADDCDLEDRCPQAAREAPVRIDLAGW